MRECPKLTVRLLFVLWFFCAVETHSFCQAWVPPKGEGDYTIAYQNLYTKDHFLGNGDRIDAGKVRLLGLVQSLDYGMTSKLAVSANVPFGSGKYTGSSPHQLPIDDGSYHGTIQDIGLGARYNIRLKPLALTPFLLTTFPSHHYEHFAHSAVGSDMWELRMGLNVGRRLRLIPNTYMQVQYSYAITQRILDIRPNKSRVNAEFGYFVTKRLAVNAVALSQFTHGGLNLLEDFPDRSPNNLLWRHHDQISRLDALNIGGGFTFSATRSINVFSSLVTSVWGRNGHALATGLTTGVSWSFRTPWTKRAAVQDGTQDSVEASAWRAKYPPAAQQQCSH